VSWTAAGILAAASALVAWRTEGTLLPWIVRDLALLGYIAVFLAIVSCYLIGANFEDWPVRVVSVAMFIVVAVLFVRQRIEARKKQAEIQAKIAAAKRVQMKEA
jgi:drug/metabolite transporter (DMT)-like permease